MRKEVLTIWLFLFLMGQVAAQPISEFRIRQAIVDWPEVQVFFDTNTQTATSGRVFASLGNQKLTPTALQSAQNVPLGITVILDPNIRNASKNLERIRSELLSWVNVLPSQDRFRLWIVGDSSDTTKSFSNNRDRLTDQIQAIVPLPHPANLYQLIEQSLAIRQQKEEGLPARQILVVISDGRDDSKPAVSHEGLIRSLAIDRIPIFIWGLSGGSLKGLTQLSELAKFSGGDFISTDVERGVEPLSVIKNRIMSGKVGIFLCPGCTPNGQVVRLNLQYQIGQNTLSDGLDVRLTQLRKSDLPNWLMRMTAYLEVFKWWILGFAVIISLVLFVFWVQLMGKSQYTKEPDTRTPHTDLTHLVPIAPNMSPTIPPSIDPMHAVVLTFTVIEGPIQGAAAVISLSESKTFGRSTLELPFLAADKSISTVHFSLTPMPNGGMLISDEGSTNKTYVNGVSIQKSFHLHPDDVIRVGKTVFRIHF